MYNIKGAKKYLKGLRKNISEDGIINHHEVILNLVDINYLLVKKCEELEKKLNDLG